MTEEQAPARAHAPEHLAPIHLPMLRIVAVGALAWAAALAVVLLVPTLHEGERAWWPWACVSGLVLGALGWAYLRRGRGNAADA